MKHINENSKIKAVIFDLDHTLFDRYETIKLVCEDMITEKSHWFVDGTSLEELQQVLVDADAKHIIGGWKPVFAYWREQGIMKLDSDGNTLAKSEEVFDFIWNYGVFLTSLP